MAIMRIQEISKSKNGTSQIVIHYDGRSYTRHCKCTPTGWQGFVLDFDRRNFLAIEKVSKDGAALLRSMGSPSMRPYAANLLFAYPSNGTAAEEYRKFIEAEHERARNIIQAQAAELILAKARFDAQQAAPSKSREKERRKAV